jgi:hypothetical protein
MRGLGGVGMGTGKAVERRPLLLPGDLLKTFFFFSLKNVQLEHTHTHRRAAYNRRRRREDVLSRGGSDKAGRAVFIYTTTVETPAGRGG